MLPLAESQQQILLHLAREAVKASACNLLLPEIVTPPGVPVEFFGVFVSLHKGEHLRGCIGHIEALKPLAHTVRECSFSAAMFDPRFHPVTPDELAELRIEISVLSPFFDIAPEQVEVGVHGLLVSCGAQHGLLLPQVAVHWKWDRVRFLNETCRKAGLNENAWRHGARIQAFTAQVFGEATHPAQTSPHAA